MIDGVYTLQDWQLTRLMEAIHFKHSDIRKRFSGFFTVTYLFRPNGQIDWYEFAGRNMRYIKTLSRADVQTAIDTYLRLPHRALQVDLKEKGILATAFFAEHDNVNDLMTMLQEIEPNVPLSADTARELYEQFAVSLEGMVQPPPSRLWPRR